MYKNILEPIGMLNSSFEYQNLDPNKKAALHVIGPNFKNAVLKNDPTTRWIVGAGGLSSNLNDMLLFTQLMLNKGTINEVQILKKETVELMLDDADNSGIGLTWNVFKLYGGKKFIDHGGNSVGVSAELAFLPEDSLGVVVLINNRNGAEWVITDAIMRVIFNLKLKNRIYPSDIVQTKLREEGLNEACKYLENTLENNIDQISSRSMMLLAYRMIQGGYDETLSASKKILELLSQYYQNDPILDIFLGEVYYRLALYHFNESVKIDSSIVGNQKMLNELKKANLNSYF
jgi:hypothetical protein